MNILICTFSFPFFPGNVHDGKFVFSEAISYAKNGAHVKVVTPHYHGADKREKIHKQITVFRFQYFIPKSLQVLKKTGVPIYNQKSFLPILQIPFLCLFFALNIFRHSLWADIIHAQWTVTAFLSLPAKWILRKKIVLTARGSDIRLLPKCLNRFIHSQVDAAIDCFGLQPWNDEYRQAFPARYIKLPLLVHNDSSGVMPEDLKKIVYQKSDPFVILYVGRFDFVKIDQNKLPLFDLIRASKILKEKGMNFHVFYVGDGEERIRKNMWRLIDEYSLHDYVTPLGIKTNVTDYIQFSHVGLGGIAFNAVSQEFTINSKPQILVTGKDNANTPWRHGVNSIFVEPEDPTDLVERLIWAMENREQIRKVGENAKKEMDTYIMDSQIGGRLYLREFQNLLI